MIDLTKNRRYDLNSERPKIDFTGDPGLTKQEPAEDADINVLMRRFGVTDGSTLPRFQDPAALYADLSNLPTDPVEIAEIMRNADLEFQKIPANLRARFGSAAGLHDYLTNEKNLDEAVSLGLLSKNLAIEAQKAAAAPTVPGVT